MRIDEQQLAVARVYARALFGLAEDQGMAQSVREELDSLAELLAAQPELVSIFDSPMVGAKRRAELVEKSFRGRLSDLVVDALQVMNRKGRLGIVPALVEAYRREHDRRSGLVQATVTTAVPLSEALRAKVEAAVLTMAKSQGGVDGAEVRSVEILDEVDESLLGGMIVRLGDRKFDSSVARELGLIFERVRERTSLEVARGAEYFADEGA